jgi:hypothetical protein
LPSCTTASHQSRLWSACLRKVGHPACEYLAPITCWPHIPETGSPPSTSAAGTLL